MRIVQVRWIFAVMFTVALINGVRSQPTGGTGERTIEPTPGPTAPADPTPAPTPGPTAPADPTPAPTPGPSDGTDTGSAGDDTDGNEASEDCSDGIEGTTDEGFVVCCASATCDTCSDEDGCDDDGCCPSAIVSSAVSCEYGGPPCIVGSGNESETSSGDSNSDTPTGVIILGAILAALLLGNVVCCFMLKRRKKSPTPLEPVPVRFNADAEMGRQQNAEILCLQEELTNERNRRMKADGIIQRAKGGGMRLGDFPSVRDVDLDLENLAGHAIKWAENASVIGGAHPALPSTVKSVLENTFLVCRQEVKRCFDERLESLSGFLGNDEPVVLSGGDSMNLDTQYVLYECLRRNFRTIVPTEPDHVKELAGMVQQRSEGVADEALAGEVIFGDGWGTFDNLVQKFIMVFVEMALQKPAMEFHDNLGESRTFDPVVHRDWAPYLKVPMEQCCVVFPAILHQEGRPKSNAKAGVVRLAA